MATYYVQSPIYVYQNDEYQEGFLVNLADLDNYDTELQNTLMFATDDFKDANLQQYFDEPLKDIIYDMEMTIDTDCTIVVKTSRKLTSEELNNLKSELSGQFSDGWGEGCSQLNNVVFWTADAEWDMIITEEDS